MVRDQVRDSRAGEKTAGLKYKSYCNNMLAPNPRFVSRRIAFALPDESTAVLWVGRSVEAF
jgi:hypothetical protein